MKKSVLTLILAGLAASTSANAAVVLAASGSNLTTDGNVKVIHQGNFKKEKDKIVYSSSFALSGSLGFATSYLINDDYTIKSYASLKLSTKDGKPSVSKEGKEENIKLDKLKLTLVSGNLNIVYGKSGNAFSDLNGASLDTLESNFNSDAGKIGASSYNSVLVTYKDAEIGNLYASTDLNTNIDLQLGYNNSFKIDEDQSVNFEAAFAVLNDDVKKEGTKYGYNLGLSYSPFSELKVGYYGAIAKDKAVTKYSSVIDASYQIDADTKLFAGISSAKDLAPKNTFAHVVYAGVNYTLVKDVKLFAEASSSSEVKFAYATGLKVSY